MSTERTADPPTPTHEEHRGILKAIVRITPQSLYSQLHAYVLSNIEQAESTAAELVKAQQQLDAFCEAAGGAQTPDDAVRWCALQRGRIAELELELQKWRGPFSSTADSMTVTTAETKL